MKTLFVSLCLCVFVFISESHAQNLLLRGGTLIDGTGNAPIQNASILIRDGVIADIRTGQSPAAASGLEIIDARGKYILPGFIDSHVHYRDWNAELFLAHGVTTVYDLGNPFHWQSAIKKGLNSGRIFGPRYFFCGEMTLPSEEEAQNRLPTIERRGLDVIRKPADAEAIVRRLKDSSVDCIKLNEDFPGDVFSAVARSADGLKLPVISHSFNAADSIRWGIDGIEHMVGIAVSTAASARAREAVGRLRLEAGHKNSSLYQWMEPSEFDGLIQQLVERHVFVNPTLAFEWKALSERTRDHEQDDLRLFSIPELAYVPLDDRLVILGQYHWPDSRSAEEIRQYKDGYRKVQQFLSKFVQAGGKIYAGTDTSAATTPGLSLHHELELLVDAGLSPSQAILTATKNGAELLGLDSKIGTVQKGKLADLVLLDANPLENIRNTKKIFKVVKDGRVVDTKYHADYDIAIKRPGDESKHLYNPKPVLRDVQPPVVNENESANLRILGRGFIRNSIVKLDRRAVETRWISATELHAVLSPRDTARIGRFLLTVESPRPGGGISEPIEFLVSFANEKVADLLNQNREFATLPATAFNSMGWELPDGGSSVKALADAAPGGAFDPKKLESLSTERLGYKARWHVLRYKYYGLDWDITGLQLTPNKPEPGLPTLAIIHGGSANWYEFFLDPLNGPGLGQYLAQRMPVMLITNPGNYTNGGWAEPNFDKRIPGYVLDRPISAEEAGVRNAVFTFTLVTEGVRQLLEQKTTGPLLILGHSTGGEIQFLLKHSSLKSRVNDRSIGWGTGGPAFLTKAQDERLGVRSGRVVTYGKYPRIDILRARDAAGYVSSNYVGPLNPLKGNSPLEVAAAWFQAEGRRRPQFKQTLQDIEHQGFVEHRARMEKEVRDTLAQNKYGIKPEEVIRDLFSTMSPPMKEYRRMAWVVGSLDDGHWDPTPETAREFNFAKTFRQENPGAPIRVLLIEAPVTHYGHIERPKQLAAVLLEAVRWVSQ